VNEVGFELGVKEGRNIVPFTLAFQWQNPISYTGDEHIAQEYRLLLVEWLGGYRAMEPVVSVQRDVWSWHNVPSSLVSTRTTRIVRLCTEGHLRATSMSSRYVRQLLLYSLATYGRTEN